MRTEHRHYRAADRLREVATLIGELQNNEVKLTNSETITPGLGMTGPAAALIERADRLENGGLRLAIVGSSRRGKSTLINALLGEKLLPTSRIPTTAVITQIIYGESKEVKLVGNHSNEKTILRQEFVDECVLEPGREIPQAFANIAYAVLESNCFLCEKGLQIVDTPGLNAMSSAERATLQYLDQVDAILIVIDSLVPFDDTDLALLNSLKRIKGSKLDHVFFIINARNLDFEGKKEVLALTRRNLKDSFDAESFKRRVFVVDAEEALNARSGENTTDSLETTGLPAFERQLTRFLESDERIDVILDAVVCDILVANLSTASAYMAERTIEASKTNLHAVEEKLALLEQTAAAIQDIFDNFTKEIADTIGDNLISQLMQLVEESNPKWNTFDIEPRALKLAIGNFSSEKQDKLVCEIIDRLTRYFHKNICDSQSRVSKDIEGKITAMSERLEREIAAFFRKVDAVETSLPTFELRKILDENHERKINQLSDKIIQSLHHLIGKLIRGGGLLSTVILTILSLSFVGIFLPFVSPKIRLSLVTIVLPISAFLLLIRANKKPIKTGIREQLKGKLLEKEETIKAEIWQSINNKIKTDSDKFRTALQTEIDHRREQLSTTTSEKSRLEIINTRLTEEFEAICRAIYKRVPTHQEQEQFLKNGD